MTSRPDEQLERYVRRRSVVSNCSLDFFRDSLEAAQLVGVQRATEGPLKFVERICDTAGGAFLRR